MGLSPDDLFLDVDRRLLLGQKERRQYARRSGTLGATKTKNGNDETFRESKDTSEKPAVPMQHHRFGAVRTYTRPVCFRNAVRAGLKIPLYIQIPIRYARHSDLFAGQIGRLWRQPEGLPICVFCEDCILLMIVVSTPIYLRQPTASFLRQHT